MIGLTQRPLPDDTKDTHDSGGGIRTQNYSKGTAEDPLLGRSGHRDRHSKRVSYLKEE